MLLEDHRKVEKLFQQFEQAEDKREKKRIVMQACIELTIHAQLEEELFYAEARNEAGREDEAVDDLLDEAQVEHQVAKDLIAQLEQGNDPEFEAKFKVLSEYVKHHVEEEEGELFPKVKRSDMDFEQLTEAMMERKRELRRELGMEGGEQSRRRESRNFRVSLRARGRS